MSLSPEEGKGVVYKGMILLAVITLIEVFIALIGNGHVIDGFHLPKWVMYPAMIMLSLYKAYYIISEFMHMKYENKGLVISASWPIILIVWAMIAFLNEGGAWHDRKAYVELVNSKGYIKPSEASLETFHNEVGPKDDVTPTEGSAKPTETNQH